MTIDPIAPCQTPSERAWPIQYLEFHREITSDKDPAGSLAKPIELQCESVNIDVRGSVLAKFVQVWTLKDVLIGDYAMLLSLAPSEILTIEVRRTQHTLLEQSQENASTVETGAESLDSDKESINVANTSARTSNWGISGTGGFSLNGMGASGTVTDNHTINDSVTKTINSIHETTVKATQKVTTQTKVQIRGVTETTVEARQTRILKNPFPDRVLDLNLYEMVKKFNVKTSQDSLQLMITGTLHPIHFTQAFISSNQPFLQQSLLDSELKSILPTLVGALQHAQPGVEQTRIDNALDVLERHLFEDRQGFQPYHADDTNDDTPLNAFTNAQSGSSHFTDIDSGASGLAISQTSKSAGFELYAVLQSYWMMMGGFPSGGSAGLPVWSTIYPVDRLLLMQGLAAAVKGFWTSLDDAARINIMSRGNDPVAKHNRRGEIFRRVPGFLNLYDELLGSLTIPQPDGTTTALVNALLNHLTCNADFYTEQYLRFLWNRLGNTFVIRCVNSILAGIFPAPSGYVANTSRPYLNLYEVEDVQRSGLSVLVPLQVGALPAEGGTIPGFITGLNQLNGAISTATSGTPLNNEVVVPAEGIHIEPVAGTCVLQLPTTGGGHNGDGGDGGKGEAKAHG